MTDLIDRQAAIEAIGKKSDEIYKTKQKGATYPHDDFFQGMAYAESVVKQLPTAQPEIVRCKDCIFHGFCITSPKWAVAPKDDWYCADAERRTDDLL